MANNFDSLRSIGAAGDGSYVQVNLTDGSYQGKTSLGEAIRSTYSLLKQSVEAYWDAIGTSPNVTNAVITSMNDPNQYMVVEGRKFCQHSGVGRLQAYNELGNPSGGCWTCHLIG